MAVAPLARDVFGVRFQNPIVLASGTAGYGRELDGVMELGRLGGLVTMAVSLQPRVGNAPPRVAEFRGGMLNSVGLANPGLAHVREAELPWLLGRLTEPISAAEVQAKFSAVSREYQQFKKSYGPRFEDTWTDLAQRAQYAGSDANKLRDLTQQLDGFRARMRATRAQ